MLAEELSDLKKAVGLACPELDACQAAAFLSRNILLRHAPRRRLNSDFMCGIKSEILVTQ